MNNAPNDPLQPTSWLKRQTAPARTLLRLATLAGLAAAIATIAQALLVAWLVHAVAIEGVAPMALWPQAAGLITATVLRALARAWQLRCGSLAAQRTVARLREELLAHLHALGPARLGQWHHGELASRVLDSVDAMESFIAHYLPQRMLAVAVPVLIAAVALLHDWLAGLLLLFTAPLIPLFMALVGWGAERLAQRFERQRARAAGVFLDRIRGLVTIRLFGAEAVAAEQVGRHAEDLRNDSMRVLRVAFLSSAVLEFFAAVAIASVAIYVGLGLLGFIGFGPAPSLTLYSGLAVLLLAPEFFAPLRQLAVHYHDRADALGAAEEILPLLQAPGIARNVARMERSAIRDDAVLALDRVDLTRDHGPVLRNFSLQVTRGECVVLAGPSGCGKTSVLHLVAGHLPPDAGSIQVTGGTAWLGQRPFLAHGSIYRNIALGREGASTEEVLAAARRTGVTEFSAALPDGLDTRIGNRGLGLSGGQAQRVALARAWLSRAPLLLLDEPTTGLDEGAVQALLPQLRALRDAGCGLLIGTHDARLRAVADRVVDMGATP